VRLDEVFPDHGHQNRSVWRTYLPHVSYVLISDVVAKDDEKRIALAWRFGMCLYTDGRYHEAEPLFVEETKRCLRVLGQEHPDTLISMANLASKFWNQGRWDEAEALELQVMETRKTKLGVDHPDTLIGMNNLAFTWKGLGRDKEALELMEKCVALRTRIIGTNHPYTLSSRIALLRWQKEELEISALPDR
jgi:hypothetical protein